MVLVWRRYIYLKRKKEAIKINYKQGLYIYEFFFFHFTLFFYSLRREILLSYKPKTSNLEPIMVLFMSD